jgi:hypothetical protein
MYESTLVQHDEIVAEQVQRIDVEDPVGPAGEVVAEDLVAVRRQREEDLQEEERDDREVVAAQSPRRQPDEEAAGRADDDHERDDDERRRVDAELLRVQHRVGVRADAVERHESEVEQAAPADDDVEAEGEQHVEHGVERHAVDVRAVREDGHQRERRDEQSEPAPPGHAVQALVERADPTRALGAALAVPRDPLVLPDRGARRGLRIAWLAHTFVMPSWPSRPRGRNSMNTMSTEKITRSDQRVVQ